MALCSGSKRTGRIRAIRTRIGGGNHRLPDWDTPAASAASGSRSSECIRPDYHPACGTAPPAQAAQAADKSGAEERADEVAIRKRNL